MERRALQIILGFLSLIPLIGVTIGFTSGVGFFFADGATVPVSLDNQFRYLSGVYVAVTLGIWYAIPRVEERLAPLRIVASGVIFGAVGRVLSMISLGLPDDASMIAGVALEGGIVPLLLLWQARLHRRHHGARPR